MTDCLHASEVWPILREEEPYGLNFLLVKLLGPYLPSDAVRLVEDCIGQSVIEYRELQTYVLPVARGALRLASTPWPGTFVLTDDRGSLQVWCLPRNTVSSFSGLQDATFAEHGGRVALQARQGARWFELQPDGCFRVRRAVCHCHPRVIVLDYGYRVLWTADRWWMEHNDGRVSEALAGFTRMPVWWECDVGVVVWTMPTLRLCRRLDLAWFVLSEDCASVAMRAGQNALLWEEASGRQWVLCLRSLLRRAVVGIVSVFARKENVVLYQSDGTRVVWEPECDTMVQTGQWLAPGLTDRVRVLYVVECTLTSVSIAGEWRIWNSKKAQKGCVGSWRQCLRLPDDRLVFWDQGTLKIVS